jgi:hypothetical protein
MGFVDVDRNDSDYCLMLGFYVSRVEISHSDTIKLGTSQIVTRRIHSFQALYVAM